MVPNKSDTEVAPPAMSPRVTVPEPKAPAEVVTFTVPALNVMPPAKLVLAPLSVIVPPLTLLL